MPDKRWDFPTVVATADRGEEQPLLRRSMLRLYDIAGAMRSHCVYFVIARTVLPANPEGDYGNLIRPQTR